MRYCRKCGAKLNDGAKFCGTCGEKLSTYTDAEAQFSSPAAKENTNTVESFDKPIKNSVQKKDRITRENKPIPKSIKTVIIILAVLAVIAVGAFIYFKFFYCDHTYTSKITTPATCIEPGTVTFTCSKCGKTYEEKTELGSHNYKKVLTTEPKCTETGEYTFTCDVCGDSYTEPAPVSGHKYSETVTKAATCTEAGEMLCTCTRCGEQYKTVIAAKGHNIVEDAAVEPTCQKEGLTSRKYCTECGEVFEEQTKIPKADHKYTDHVCEFCGKKDYGWNLTILCVNNSAYSKSSSSSIGKNSSAYVHYKLDGWFANEKLKIYSQLVDPNGGKTKSSNTDTIKPGEYYLGWYHQSPAYALSGDYTIEIYNADGYLLDSYTFYWGD